MRLPRERDGVEFLTNGCAVQELLDEIHEERDENRCKSLNKDLNKLIKETGKKGLGEFACLPEC